VDYDQIKTQQENKITFVKKWYATAYMQH
jgi:hypothetical protein